MLSALLPASVRAVLNKPFHQMTDQEIVGILADFGLGSYHPELRQAAVALLRDKGIDTAADVIQSPEAVVELRDLIAKFKPAKQVCGFCEATVVFQEHGVCPKCGINN